VKRVSKAKVKVKGKGGGMRETGRETTRDEPRESQRTEIDVYAIMRVIHRAFPFVNPDNYGPRYNLNRENVYFSETSTCFDVLLFPKFSAGSKSASMITDLRGARARARLCIY